MIIDSHCHVSDRWYEPVEVLIWQMDRLGIDVGILTQYSGQFDNSYQTECVRRYPGRLASVVVVDSTAPDAPATLARLVDEGATGVRFRVDARAGGSDPLAVWRAAERLGISATVLGSEHEFLSDDFDALVASVPDLPLVIEHLGTGGETGLAYSPDDAARVFALSRYPHVHMKFHGLAEFSPRVPDRTSPDVFIEPLRPHLRMAFDAFGADRLMWGSDFPPVSSREGYGLSLDLPRDALRRMGLSDDELFAVFAGTAARFHRLALGVRDVVA